MVSTQNATLPMTLELDSVNYRPQSSCGKVVFTGVCHSVHGGVSQHALGQTPPWADNPLGRQPPVRHPPTATAADSTHPTGMHSCYSIC